MNDNIDFGGYLPSVREKVKDYSDSEKEELIYQLLDERDELIEKTMNLESKASTDAMTGLNDFGEFYKSLKENVSRANRGGKFSLLMIDLNDFKGVNDNYGHQMGDKVLKKVSEVLESNVREHDKAFRYGGDEFALQIDGSDTEKSLEVAGRIYDEIMELDVWKDVSREKVDYGLSIGVSDYEGGSGFDVDVTADTVSKLADEAMYLAKQSENSDIAVADYGEEFFKNIPAYSVRTVSDF